MNNSVLPNDPLLGQQWHLINTGQVGKAGNDVNIQPAWNIATGKGVVIGIVDDGFQFQHPDLSPNYRADLSYDFDDDDADPSPFLAPDPNLPPDYPLDLPHGTSVAGVAAAAGNNQTGVTGAAFNAGLAGIKLNIQDDDAEARALSYKNQHIDIYNASWGPFDDARRLEKPGPKTRAAIADSIQNGRGGLGNIYVWSAGNGGAQDNVNYDGYASSRYTIAVGAIDSRGKQSSYSEKGASLLVTTYSSGDRLKEGITTTDLTGDDGYAGADETEKDYTPTFGGTSSSAPLASGVIALMLEANPNLSWRDVQHILVNTAKKNDASDSDWAENGAGHLVNHKYGFGSIDAGAAVAAAKAWQSVAPETSGASGIQQIKTDIPEGNALGITSVLSIKKDINIESVELNFNAKHKRRGNLEVTLISPDGTESILAEKHRDTNRDYKGWTFTSMRHWGESAKGEWLLRVVDRTTKRASGALSSIQLKVHGTADTPTPQLVPLNGTQQSETLAGDAQNNRINGRAGDDTILGKSGHDLLLGRQGNDRLNGGQGKDKLKGDIGRDTLIGGDDRDILTGGKQNDLLLGGTGDDVLTGGLGRDTLRGDEGSDRFNYDSVREGGDVIKAFNSKEDLVDLHGILSPLKDNFSGNGELFENMVQLKQVGIHTVVQLKSFDNQAENAFKTLLTLRDTTASDLSMSNFIV